jgi:inner membrane translocase subunit Tim23
MSASESHEAIDRPALALPMFGAGVDVGTAAPLFGSMTSSGDDIDYLEYDKKGRGVSERMFYNAGISYTVGTFAGGAYGFVEGWRSSPSRRMKIRVNSVLNGMGKRGGRWGNAIGTVALLYSGFEAFADFAELEHYTGGFDVVNPIAAAVATGMLYKCTKGPKVMALAGVLGAGVVGSGVLGARLLRGKVAPNGILGSIIN